MLYVLYIPNTALRTFKPITNDILSAQSKSAFKESNTKKQTTHAYLHHVLLVISCNLSILGLEFNRI